MGLNKKSVDNINVNGKRVLVRCDFNVPLKEGKITDETRINAALPTIQKLIADGGKVILCSHLGKVKEGPNEKESLAPVAVSLSEKLGKDVARRVIDFISGAVYALGGSIQKVSGGIFLIAPYNVGIMGDFKDELRNKGIFPWSN